MLLHRHGHECLTFEAKSFSLTGTKNQGHRSTKVQKIARKRKRRMVSPGSAKARIQRLKKRVPSSAVSNMYVECTTLSPAGSREKTFRSWDEQNDRNERQKPVVGIPTLKCSAPILKALKNIKRLIFLTTFKVLMLRKNLKLLEL
jgi:hypothetical protein